MIEYGPFHEFIAILVFYCKTGCEVKCNKVPVIAMSFAIIYCNTGYRHIVSEKIKIPCCLRYLIDFMTVSNELSLNTVLREMFLLVFEAHFL